MDTLIPLAEQVATLLKKRKETIAVAESSAGGLISAALLAVPGASAYFLGGAVVYTRQARQVLLDIPDSAVQGMRSSSEPYAALLARTVRRRYSATWGLAETGAAGPSGNIYGDPAGHSCLAVDGPVTLQRLLRTGQPERLANMAAFALAALALLAQALEQAGPPSAKSAPP